MKYLRNVQPYQKIDLSQFVIGSQHKISSKAIIDKDALEIRFFAAAAGESIDKERYQCETIFVCLNGHIRIIYQEDESVELRAGEMLVLESDVYYGLESLEDSTYYNILIDLVV